MRDIGDVDHPFDSDRKRRADIEKQRESRPLFWISAEQLREIAKDVDTVKSVRVRRRRSNLQHGSRFNAVTRGAGLKEHTQASAADRHGHEASSV